MCSIKRGMAGQMAGGGDVVLGHLLLGHNTGDVNAATGWVRRIKQNEDEFETSFVPCPAIQDQHEASNFNW